MGHQEYICNLIREVFRRLVIYEEGHLASKWLFLFLEECEMVKFSISFQKKTNKPFRKKFKIKMKEC